VYLKQLAYVQTETNVKHSTENLYFHVPHCVVGLMNSVCITAGASRMLDPPFPNDKLPIADTVCDNNIRLFRG